MFWRIFKKISLVSTLFGLAVGITILSVILVQVFFGDYENFTRESIYRRISAETSVYFRDGQKKLGVFFNGQHRTYATIDEIPAHLLNAFTSAEDYYFYKHPGFNPFSFVRAMLANLRHGRVVQGGSTLTMQTSEILFSNGNHTFSSKFKELVQSLKLERSFSKQDILEFYLNQFHVVSNGRGVGIAAKYYFNKSVSDLNLNECAFVAGSVKGPSRYNPKMKKDPAAKARASERARIRKDWVLTRMLKNRTILQEEFDEWFEKPVDFNFGTFRYKEVSMLNFIRKQLNKTEILKALGLKNVNQIATSGLKIITTLDAEFQASAQYQMRRNLSRVEYMLSGFKKGSDSDFSSFKDIRDINKGDFIWGKVVDIQNDSNGTILYLDYGPAVGEISYASIKKFAYHGRFFSRPKKPYSVAAATKISAQKILNKIAIGDVIFSSIEKVERENMRVTANIEVKPKVQGGFVILDRGNLLTLVSGFDVNTYNRAIFGRRQPGSVFKSLVIYAALQLGWNILDKLDNTRKLITFEREFYFPRPDHRNANTDVSLAWAAAKSENLASISLLKHITDKLTFDQFKELATSVDMAPRLDESIREFGRRMRDKMGVAVNRAQTSRFYLADVIEEILPDIIFSSDDLETPMKTLWYGIGADSQIQEYTDQLDHDIMNKRLEEARENNKKIPNPLPKKEILFRLAYLKNNILRYKTMGATIKRDLQRIFDHYYTTHPQNDGNQYVSEDLLTDSNEIYRKPINAIDDTNSTTTADANDNETEITELLKRYYVRYDPYGNIKRVSYFEVPPNGLEEMPKNYFPLTIETLFPLIAQDANEQDEEMRHFSATRIFIDDRLPPTIIDKIAATLKLRVDKLWQDHGDLPYSLNMLSYNTDFRILMGLRYIIQLAKTIGIDSRLSPVLSFPLGTNIVSIAECAKVYQTFLSGKIYRFFENNPKSPKNQLNIIKQIEDRFGNLLYRSQSRSVTIVDPVATTPMLEILGKTMTQGTGRYQARRVVLRVGDHFDDAGLKRLTLKVPTYGKTGTTNDYTNSTFVGFLPYPTLKNVAINPKNAYVLAGYVGYDQNIQMSRKPIHVTGAQGALPLWVDIAKSVVKSKRYIDYLDVYDLTTQKKGTFPVKHNESTIPIRIDGKSGLPISVVNHDQQSLNPINESFFNYSHRNVIFSYARYKNEKIQLTRFFKLYNKLIITTP